MKRALLAVLIFSACSSNRPNTITQPWVCGSYTMRAEWAKHGVCLSACKIMYRQRGAPLFNDPVAFRKEGTERDRCTCMSMFASDPIAKAVYGGSPPSGWIDGASLTIAHVDTPPTPPRSPECAF